MRYVKETFDPVNIDHAKHIVLTSDPADPDKFEKETSAFINILASEGIITDTSLVLDFGCGMGRISKELINRFGCNVIGVDISEKMKIFAMLYISNPKKFSTSDIVEPNSFDICISAFVLQHTEHPRDEILKIVNGLKNNGMLVLLNENVRYVPADVDMDQHVIWHDDKFNVHSEVEKYLKKVKSIPYPPNTSLSIDLYKKDV